MAKNLVIVESPGKVKTISKVLGKNFTVKASVGHVRDLPKTAKEDVKGSIVRGVAKDFTPTYVTLPAKKKVLDGLKKFAATAEKVYLCPDPDREGEAIAWHLAQALKLTPEKAIRVTFDEITPRGIKLGLASPREINMDLVDAQQARRVVDRIVGYKLSPLLSEKIGGGWLTAGRVQSVAVRLLVVREKEIQAFTPEEYWTVGATFKFDAKNFEAALRGLDGRQVVSNADDLMKFKSGQSNMGASGIVRTLIQNGAEAKAIVAALKNAAFTISNYDVKEVKDHPYPPFATSQLQQAAANRLGFDAKRTMRVAQQLYEGVALGDEGPVALITYMRTDSFRISPDALTEVRDLIGKKFGDKYLPEKPNAYASRAGSQGAHECVRPTHIEITPESVQKLVSDEQFKLYRLIYQRFVACQMVPAVFDATTADVAASGPGTRNAVFRANGRVLKFEGWLAVQGGAASAAAHVEATAADREKGDEVDGEPENDGVEGKAEKPGAAPATAKKKSGPQILPAMKVGDKPKLEEIRPEEHFTQPPPRYTEASLVKILEREGIGRPSTYATIIATIQDRGYAQKLGAGGRGSFMATPLGITVTERLEGHFPSIMELSFTRDMEVEFDKIEELHLDWKQVVKDFYTPFEKELIQAKKTMITTKDTGEKSDVPCPECGGVMEKRLSKFGYYLRCTKDGCKGSYNLDPLGNIKIKEGPQPTGLKCDICGSDVVKSTGRFGPYLHCVRYSEKKCTYTMKLNKEGHPLRKFKPFPTDKKCEKCKGDMVVRVTSRGKTRRPFLSCANFPKCRAAADLPPDLAALGEQAMAQWHDIDAKNKADLVIYQAVLNAMPKEEVVEEAAAE